MLIIGILASVALPQYEKAVEKSRAAGAFQIIKSINDAQKVANLEKGTTGIGYPFDELSVSFTDKNGNTATGYSFNGKDFRFSIGTGYQSAGSFVGESPAAAWVDAGVSRCNGGSGPCYVLGINNGRRTCGPFSTKGTETCKSIVGSKTLSGSSSSSGETCVSGNTCYTE